MQKILLWLLVGLLFLVPIVGQAQEKDPFGAPQIEKVKGKVPILEQGEVRNFGKVVYKGDIDVNPTLERIREGKKLSHANDGAIFHNREKKLPGRRDGYYREFVIPTDGVKPPGPQRLVLGKGGEVFYTGDHYNHFHRVNP